MASRHYPIRRHSVWFEAGGGMVRLKLWSDGEREVAELGFLDPDRRLPAAQVSAALDHGVGFLPQTSLLPLLTLLAQPTTVYVLLDDDPVGSLCIHT
ncbi:hypothetical protein [Chitinimonas lacunae]|uniref:GNAT family N-acetyltransferase n=1 Tax=Chitinimonas lacunae TaxID=1963018 RepID=A0ABV8MJY5_9NEIS